MTANQVDQPEQTRPERTCVVWCLDWPIVVARQRDPTLVDRPVIVAERVGSRELVRSASTQARTAGVTTGLRRREAESRCPGLIVLDTDIGEEAAAFESVARAVEMFTPRIEITRPGVLAFPTRGPSRYFGGDEVLARRVRAEVCSAMHGDSRGVTSSSGSDARVGIADGRFAAQQATRRALTNGDAGTLVVPPGGSAEFLAPFPVAAIDDEEMAMLLVRLGLLTLGDFAALDPASVVARFGLDGRRRHRLAGGFDDRAGDLHSPPPDLVEQQELDPPATRVDQAMFAAKALGDRLLARLDGLGLGCVRIVVEAETEHGERLSRVWRHEGALTPTALAERVRWQLDGWLRADGGARPRVVAAEGDVREAQDAAALAESFDTTTGALALIRLVPDEVVGAGGRQLGFWGGDPAASDRADRALSRVQGLLGYEVVSACVPQGGRTPPERVRWVPWGEPREPERPVDGVAGPVVVERPQWPGTVPGPAPARIFEPPIPVELLDEAGDPVRVSGRGEALGLPAELRTRVLPGNGGRVLGAAGPWAHDVRWWDAAGHRRRARWQITVAAGDVVVACLVAIERGAATLEAVYD